jgi:hypothetical protein
MRAKITLGGRRSVVAAGRSSGKTAFPMFEIARFSLISTPVSDSRASASASADYLGKQRSLPRPVLVKCRTSGSG